jgi:hypothetical protein
LGDIAANWPRHRSREIAMLVVLKLLKILSRAITEAKMQRIERELMLRGIPFPPFVRAPRD